MTLEEPETDVDPVFVITSKNGKFLEELQPVRIPSFPNENAIEFCRIASVSADDFNGDDRPDFVIRMECGGEDRLVEPINGIFLSRNNSGPNWVQAHDLNDLTFGMASYDRVYQTLKNTSITTISPPAGPRDRYYLPTVIDAAMDWNRKTAILFQSNVFFMYDKPKDRVMRGYPKSINPRDWPGLWTGGCDAAVNWHNGKVYFFRGGSYLRYDASNGRMDKGYPKPINNETWPGLWPGGVDAAINWGNGKAYFFKGNMYIRYDIAADRADPGYPKPINHKTWPGLVFTNGIDAAVNWGNGKAYFFSGGDYIRYDLRTDKADPGYPKPINQKTWPGITY